MQTFLIAMDNFKVHYNYEIQDKCNLETLELLLIKCLYMSVCVCMCNLSVCLGVSNAK